MATYLRLFPKPFVVSAPENADYKAFHVDPGMNTEDVEKLISDASFDEQIVLKVVLPDLAFPVPFGFRKCDWSAWMVHGLPDQEGQ